MAASTIDHPQQLLINSSSVDRPLTRVVLYVCVCFLHVCLILIRCYCTFIVMPMIPLANSHNKCRRRPSLVVSPSTYHHHTAAMFNNNSNTNNHLEEEEEEEEEEEVLSSGHTLSALPPPPTGDFTTAAYHYPHHQQEEPQHQEAPEEDEAESDHDPEYSPHLSSSHSAVKYHHQHQHQHSTPPAKKDKSAKSRGRPKASDLYTDLAIQRFRDHYTTDRDECGGGGGGGVDAHVWKKEHLSNERILRWLNMWFMTEFGVPDTETWNMHSAGWKKLRDALKLSRDTRFYCRPGMTATAAPPQV